MVSYQKLAESVIISKNNNRLLTYDNCLNLIGIGRSAYVFRIKSTDKAMKVFFPLYSDLAREETNIYQSLQDLPSFPTIYDKGINYFVMDYIDGQTLFSCISSGVEIEEEHIREVDQALEHAANRGLNPSDIHLRNILLTKKGDIKIIDVARFRQTKSCRQWNDLKIAYHTIYRKRFFPKKLPAFIMNTIAALYKKNWIPIKL